MATVGNTFTSTNDAWGQPELCESKLKQPAARRSPSTVDGAKVAPVTVSVRFRTDRGAGGETLVTLSNRARPSS